MNQKSTSSQKIVWHIKLNASYVNSYNIRYFWRFYPAPKRPTAQSLPITDLVSRAVK